MAGGCAVEGLWVFAALVIFSVASPCLCQGAAPAPGPAVLQPGGSEPWNSSVYKANVIVRTWGDDLIPFNVTKQSGIIQALEAIMFPQVSLAPAPFIFLLGIFDMLRTAKPLKAAASSMLGQVVESMYSQSAGAAVIQLGV
jgi:hypothetical protein